MTRRGYTSRVARTLTIPSLRGSRSSVDTTAFWRDGYTIVRGVYTPDQIQQFRDGVHASTGPKTDLLANPRLRSVLTDGRLVGIAREILGARHVVYAGDSSFTVGNKQHGYHKDNADRLDPAAPDWNGRSSQASMALRVEASMSS